MRRRLTLGAVLPLWLVIVVFGLMFAVAHAAEPCSDQWMDIHYQPHTLTVDGAHACAAEAALLSLENQSQSSCAVAAGVLTEGLLLYGEPYGTNVMAQQPAGCDASVLPQAGAPDTATGVYAWLNYAALLGVLWLVLRVVMA